MVGGQRAVVERAEDSGRGEEGSGRGEEGSGREGRGQW